jgi:1-deoxy-D-xylulose-5-phosphate reductoisomerase
MPCILNAANEVVVDAFLKNKIGFLKMTNVIEKCMGTVSFINHPSVQDVLETDQETRNQAIRFIADFC